MFGTAHPSVGIVSGIVQFKGAMSTTGTNQVAFTLPKAFRPATDVYVPVDLCNSAEGRLFILPSGVVTVTTEETLSDAQCFTSLDGASFARTASGFRSLKPKNGWKNRAFNTAPVGLTSLEGVSFTR
ncbi:MAG: hypothetical protein ACRDRJ_45815 [Streptosporangiaceae bacterium]